MLSALAGADALEILVVLRNMASSGLSKLESDVARTEGKVNSTNFSGFSKASKTMETDAEKAAGKAEGGGGGLGNMISSALGIPGPLLIAGAAVGGFAALSAGTIPVYEKTQEELKATAAAAKAHGVSMADLAVVTDRMTTAGANYGIGADDVRQSVEKMTLAGLNADQQRQASTAILNLSVAKNISLADATEIVTKALYGSAKGLVDLGIKLPSVTVKAFDLAKATSAVSAAHLGLDSAQKNLLTTEAAMAKSHASAAIKADTLRIAHEKVTIASDKLKDAQKKLKDGQVPLTLSGDRLNTVLGDINKATGDQSGTTDSLKVAQTRLSDAWDKFANTVAPAVTAALTAVIGALSAIVGWLSDMFTWLGKIFSISETGTKNLAKIQASGTPTSNNRGMLPIGYGSHAEGGWVGQRGPGLALVGEKGPEYISPTSSPMGMGGGGHITININTTWPPTTEQAKQIAQTVAKHLARNLNVAPKTTRPYGSL